MTKIISQALLLCGLVILVVGAGGLSSFNQDVSALLYGSSHDRAVGMVIAGAVAGVVGLAGVMIMSKQAKTLRRRKN